LEQQSAFEETCERYLLGELSEAEREQFEEAYFTDDSLFERFLVVKDELLDAYARGELAEEKRVLFARHFLAAEPRRRQLGEAQEFIRAVTAVSTKAASSDGAIADAPFSNTTPESSWRESLANFFNIRPSAWQFAFAALLLITLGGTLILVRFWQQPTREEQAVIQTTPSPTVFRSNSENQNAALPTDDAQANKSPISMNAASKPASKNPANNNQSPANSNAAPTPTPKIPARSPQISTAQIAFVTLLPVASRDIGEANTLRLKSDTRAARARLVFKSGDYRDYSATITTIEGVNVWQQKSLKANTGGADKSVTLQFPPALLTGQDYIVTLKGQTAAGQTETIGEYYFRVEHSPSQNTPTPEPQP